MGEQPPEKEDKMMTWIENVVFLALGLVAVHNVEVTLSSLIVDCSVCTVQCALYIRVGKSETHKPKGSNFFWFSENVSDFLQKKFMFEGEN